MDIEVRAISLWDRLRLLFVETKVDWNHDEKMVTKYKFHKGVMYILRQEPMANGDQRNFQIDRFESWL